MADHRRERPAEQRVDAQSTAAHFNCLAKRSVAEMLRSAAEIEASDLPDEAKEEELREWWNRMLGT